MKTVRESWTITFKLSESTHLLDATRVKRANVLEKDFIGRKWWLPTTDVLRRFASNLPESCLRAFLKRPMNTDSYFVCDRAYYRPLSPSESSGNVPLEIIYLNFNKAANLLSVLATVNCYDNIRLIILSFILLTQHL